MKACYFMQMPISKAVDVAATFIDGSCLTLAAMTAIHGVWNAVPSTRRRYFSLSAALSNYNNRITTRNQYEERWLTKSVRVSSFVQGGCSYIQHLLPSHTRVLGVACWQTNDSSSMWCYVIIGRIHLLNATSLGAVFKI